MKRRDWLKLIGAASSTTVVAGCKKVGTEKLIPYLIPPDDGVIPGEAHYVHTTCTECPAGCGITARVVDGYPVKLEGRKGHPINDGRLCIRGQASLTRLYHPDRIKHPLRKVDGEWQKISWDDAYDLIRKGLADAKKQGKRNIWLSGRTTGTLSELIDEFCEKMDVERWPEYEPISYATLRKANEIVFGQPVIPDYRIDKADFLLTIGADILETFVSPVLFARRLEEARKNPDFRWVHVEPHVSLTGLQADERLVVKPGSEVAVLGHVLRKEPISGMAIVGSLRMDYGRFADDITSEVAAAASGVQPSVLDSVRELFRTAAHPLIVFGGVSAAQPTGLLGAVLAALLLREHSPDGETLDLISRDEAESLGSVTESEELAGQLADERIGAVLLSRVPPMGAQSADLAKATFRAGLDEFLTPIMGQCDVVLPLSHSLESWGDVVPNRGVRSAVRPVLEALHDTRVESEVLADLAAGEKAKGQAGEQAVREKWTEVLGEGTAEQLVETGYRKADWTPSYDSGALMSIDAGTNEKPVRHPAVDHPLAVQSFRFLEDHKITTDARSDSPALCITPSPRWYDGRSRVLTLLEEVPDPLTTVTYGDWVLIGDGTAKELGVEDGDHVRISKGDWSAELPVKKLVVERDDPESKEGHAPEPPLLQDDVYVVHMGMLDDLPMRIDEETGEADWVLSGIEVTKTGGHTALPVMAFSTSQEGRGVIPDPVHVGHGHDREHEKGREEHSLFHKPGHFRDKSMYPPHEHKDYQWAMVIDLDKCNGCGACAAACQIENNIPVVGREEHLKGREMSWLRVEPRYEQGENGVAVVSFTPMMCQQCHSAPCEPVCPVYATVHSEEGLNAQIYNRCVGTRYCANNCPYKVRRFNWFDHPREEPLDKMVNPDMLVRGRGVMEKCTFCVQRIRAARDHAKDENRKIRDGEVMPACGQTCPMGAIAFGNLKDPESRVYKLAHSDRAFRVFEHLNTEPSVYYLKMKVRSV